MNIELIRKALEDARKMLFAAADRGHYPPEALQENGGNGLSFISAALAELSAPPDPDEHLPDDQYLVKKQERFALNPQSDEDGSDEDLN